MYCRNCGHSLEEGSNFCRICGTNYKAGEPDHASPLAQDVFSFPSQHEERLKRKPVGRTLGLVIAIGIIILLFLGLGRSGNYSQSASNSTDVASKALDNAGENLEDIADRVSNEAAAENSRKSSVWTYSTDEDKVRGQKSYFARTTSTNSIFQSSPYDSSTTMDIVVRKSPAHGTDVILVISSGQMMCPSYEGCSGTARFDNGPAQRLRFNGPADSSSETIFIVGAKEFINKMKTSKRLVIEKTLYEAGNPQFEFDVSNLKWDH